MHIFMPLADASWEPDFIQISGHLLVIWVFLLIVIYLISVLILREGSLD